MKQDVLLIVDADSSSTELVSLAAMQTKHRVIRAKTSREAFHVLNGGLDAVNVIVVDVDPGVHGMAVIEAIDVSPTSPPVILLTSLEEGYMAPIAAAHGAAACVGKPFTVGKLASVIEEVCAPSWRSAACSCDAWGHPHRCKTNFIACPGCSRKLQENFRQPEPANT